MGGQVPWPGRKWRLGLEQVEVPEETLKLPPPPAQRPAPPRLVEKGQAAQKKRDVPEWNCADRSQRDQGSQPRGKMEAQTSAARDASTEQVDGRRRKTLNGLEQEEEERRRNLKGITFVTMIGEGGVCWWMLVSWTGEGGTSGLSSPRNMTGQFRV